MKISVTEMVLTRYSKRLDGNARTVHTARQYYEQTTVAQVSLDATCRNS